MFESERGGELLGGGVFLGRGGVMMEAMRGFEGSMGGATLCVGRKGVVRL